MRRLLPVTSCQWQLATRRLQCPDYCKLPHVLIFKSDLGNHVRDRGSRRASESREKLGYAQSVRHLDLAVVVGTLSCESAAFS